MGVKINKIEEFLNGEDRTLEISDLFEKSLNSNYKNKRGIFYTNKEIADLISKKSLEFYFKKGYEKKDLLKLKILEPSCGCGEFYLSYLRNLYVYYKKFFCNQTDINILKMIVKNNLYAFEIDKKAIDILKQRLEYYSIYEYENIYNIDFLKYEFEEKFDIISGNPPYIGEKGNKKIFDDIKKFKIGKKYYEKNMDYFYFFIEKSIDSAKDNGVISFITTNYWVSADNAKILRQKISDETSFLRILDFKDKKIFKNAAGQHNMVFYLKKTLDLKYDKFNHIEEKIKKTNLKDLIIGAKNLDEDKIKYKICSNKELKEALDKKDYFCFMKTDIKKLIDRIKIKSKYKLEDISIINQGIVSGADKISNRNIKYLKEEMIKKNNIKLKDGVFVLKDEELNEKKIEKKYIKKFYKNSNLNKYIINEITNLNIIYLNRKSEINKDLNVYKHLIKYKNILESKRECKKNLLPWYSLHWARNQSIFKGEKLLVAQRAKSNNFCYSNSDFYSSADVYYITKVKEDINYLLGYLNSEIIYFWLYHKGKKKGEYLELYKEPLRKIPILEMEDKAKNKIIKKTKKIINLLKENEYNIKRFVQKKANLDFLKEYNNLKSDIDNIIYESLEFDKNDIKVLKSSIP